MIPHSRPSLHPDDIAAVTKVLNSSILTGGGLTERFEAALADYVGRRCATAVSSGTAALYTALSALGVGPGDDVVIPAYVCSSLLYAVRFCGANPVLADSGDDLFHIDGDTVRKALTPAAKAVIFPHMFGAAKDIGDIVSTGVPVIEDCALSLGAEYDGAKTGNLGSCAAVYSFYSTKVIATGEGGMVVSDDSAITDYVGDVSHYADKIDRKMRFNFAMTDIAAALGISQLSRIDSMIARRRDLAGRYSESFQGLQLTLPTESDKERHIFYRYAVRTGNIDSMQSGLADRGIRAERPVYAPLSRYPATGSDCPRAEEAWRMTLSIPLYPSLTDYEADTVIESVADIVD